jgi:hypothetical protein
VDLLETRIVNRIELRPLSEAHRVRGRDLRVYARDDQAGDYREITGWRAQLGTDGSVMIVFPAKLEARYLKIATVWDDRDIDIAAVDSAQFRNALRRLVQVWTLNEDRHEAYGYDRAGNRVSLTVDGKVSLYRYYRNALGGNLPLLEFDGVWHYGYDGAGNTVWKAKAVAG